MLENNVFKFINWIQASNYRKRVLKIMTIVYSLSFLIYLGFFFKFQNYNRGGIELLAALVFYLMIWTFALTFKKQKNEK